VATLFKYPLIFSWLIIQIHTNSRPLIQTLHTVCSIQTYTFG
jgi:hypothetical protein